MVKSMSRPMAAHIFNKRRRRDLPGIMSMPSKGSAVMPIMPASMGASPVSPRDGATSLEKICPCVEHRMVTPVLRVAPGNDGDTVQAIWAAANVEALAIGTAVTATFALSSCVVNDADCPLLTV